MVARAVGLLLLILASGLTTGCAARSGGFVTVPPAGWSDVMSGDLEPFNASEVVAGSRPEDVSEGPLVGVVRVQGTRGYLTSTEYWSPMESGLEAWRPRDLPVLTLDAIPSEDREFRVGAFEDADWADRAPTIGGVRVIGLWDETWDELMDAAWEERLAARSEVELAALEASNPRRLGYQDVYASAAEAGLDVLVLVSMTTGFEDTTKYAVQGVGLAGALPEVATLGFLPRESRGDAAGGAIVVRVRSGEVIGRFNADAESRMLSNIWNARGHTGKAVRRSEERVLGGLLEQASAVWGADGEAAGASG